MAPGMATQSLLLASACKCCTLRLLGGKERAGDWTKDATWPCIPAAP
jgi:hypothetical protein